MLAKSQLHFHTNVDPKDTFIKYSPYQAIDEASKHGYKFLSFTHHLKYIWDDNWQKYAFEKGVILIGGAEIEINGKHILVYGCDEKLNYIKTFDELAQYKKSNPNVFVVAPHPFYPGRMCLGKKLVQHSDIFDGVEYSFLYMKRFGNMPNILAQKFAIKYKKPIIGTSDVHNLKDINHTYSLVDVDFDIQNLKFEKLDFYIKNFFENIKKNNVYIISKPLTLKKLFLHNMFFARHLTIRFCKNILKLKK